MNKIIYPTSKKIFVIESLKNKINELELFFENEKNSIFIINGGVCFIDSEKEIADRINILNQWQSKYEIYYNKNDLDLIYLNKLAKSLIFSSTYDWIRRQSAYTKIDFCNQTSILVISGGFEKDLNNDAELCFTNLLEKEPWQKYYNGELGFIVSNNPKSTKENLTTWDYSCSIGNITNNIGVQEISGRGLLNFFII